MKHSTQKPAQIGDNHQNHVSLSTAYGSLLVILFLFSSFVSFSQTQIGYDAVVDGAWRFNGDVELYGKKTFYTDGLKPVNIMYSSLLSRLEIGIAQGNGNYSPGTQAGDIVLRRLGEGKKLIISNGTTHDWDSSRATGILASNSEIGLWVHNNGNVRLGKYSSSAPRVKLAVDGSIEAKEVKITSAPGADFVFDEDYYLRDLQEVESFIKENKHLPEIPSATEMEASGVNLAEMNKLLLMKVEELTLYMIELRNEINTLKAARNEASK
jgi:hypothetical protein